MNFYDLLLAKKLSGGGGGSGEWTTDGIAQNLEPNGAIDLNVTSILAHAFVRKPITSVKGDAVEAISNGAFSRCSNLSSVDFPNVDSLSSTVFEYCTALETLYLPNVTGFVASSTFVFQESGLKTIVLPKYVGTNSGWQTFAKARLLEKLDILGGSNTTLIQQTFSDNAKMDTLIIRSDSVTKLGNINCFNNTPFASGKSGGTLYVPSSLVSSYQTSTNWSTILGYANNSIQAIEGSIYENAYADGTPIS